MESASLLENTVIPFMLENAEVRGRVVRLGTVADTILRQYPYPPCVARVLGELLVVAAMLSSNLKSDGILTIQIKGKGAVPLLVADAAQGGALRGYAEVAEGKDAVLNALANPTLAEIFGVDAYLAITLDPGAGLQRYQGVVALTGTHIAEALAEYFNQSQQIEAQLKLAVSLQAPFAASGFMIERLPHAAEDSDSWPYAQAIAATVTDEELLDPLLDGPSLLYRLFHEEGVRVYDAHPMRAECRCSRQRIEELLLSMPLTDRADMLVDGVASVHCQFCNTTQRFTRAELGLGEVQ